MTELFGTPLGQLAFDQNTRQNQLTNMSLAESGQKLQLGAMQITQQQKMIDLMNKQGDLGADLPTQLDTLAQLSIRSGNPAQAAELAKSSSSLRRNEAALADSQIKATTRKLNLLSGLMDSVTDDASWRQANMLYTMETGERTPWAMMPYSPDLVGKLKQGVGSAKDRALTAAAVARTQDSIAETAERKARRPLIQAQTALAEARTAVLNKAGAGAPKAQDIREITDLIAQDYYTAGPEDARVIAEPIANRMNDLIRTEGLTRQQAAVRAYQEAKSEQTFVGLRVRSRAKGSLASPLPMPKVEKDLRPNMWYQGQGKYAGQLLQWDGEEFKPQGEEPTDTEENLDEEAE